MSLTRSVCPLSWLMLLTLLSLARASRAEDRALPRVRAGGRILVLDDFSQGTSAWKAEEALAGRISVVKAEDVAGPVLECSLGEKAGKLTYLRLKNAKDFGRYNRMAMKLRAWDSEGRQGVGCAVGVELRVSGWPKHHADQFPSWGVYDRNPQPSRDWRAFDLYMDYPSWYPWGKNENKEPGLWFSLRSGFAPKAVLQIAEVCLIDDVVEVHGDWGRMESRGDGSAVWTYRISARNRTNQPQKVKADIVPPALEKFQAKIVDATKELAAKAKDVLRVQVIMPAQAIAETPPLYAESLYLKVTPLSAPETATAVRLLATKPFVVKQRPCLEDTAEEWEEKRAAFAEKKEAQKAKQLQKADALMERDIVLPAPYTVNRTFTLVDGSVETVSASLWAAKQTCTACKAKCIFPDPNTAKCTKCGKLYPNSDAARVYWHTEYFKAVKTLAEAYRLTGKRSYAEKAAEILKAYGRETKNYPLKAFTAGRAQSAARFALNNLHESWRIMPLCIGYDLIYDVPGLFTDEERQAIHADFLIPVGESLTTITSWFTNMTTVRNFGAAMCGINAGHSNLVHLAVSGHAGMRRTLEAAINPDGCTTEIPLNYHWANLKELLRLAIVLKNTGVDIPYPKSRMKRACEMPYLRAFPNGLVPGFGPHGYGQGPGYGQGHYKYVLQLYPDAVFKRLADRKESRAVIQSLPSLRFPHTELVLLREGNGPDMHCVSLLFGNQRRCHDAALAFTWEGCGELLAPAIGSWYNVTRLGQEIPPSPFYCQLIVDDHHQVGSTGSLVFHRFGKGAQIASAQANEIYPGVEVQRTLALYDGLLFVADRLASDQAHAYQWVHLCYGDLKLAVEPMDEATPTYERDKLKLTGRSTQKGFDAEWSAKKIRLRLFMAGGGLTDVMSGDSVISPGSKRFLTPMLMARRKARNTVFLAVFEPYRDARRIQAVQLETLPRPAVDGVALRVRTARGDLVFALNYSGRPMQGADWHLSQLAEVFDLRGQHD